MSLIRYKAWGLLLLLSLIVARPVDAREATIRDIVVTNSSTDLLLFLKMEDAFSPEIIEGVQNGLAATFNYEIQLRLVRTGWPDKLIYQGQLDHTMTYDPIKKGYRLLLTENGAEEIALPTLAKAQAMMSEVQGARLVPLGTLQPDRQYLLKVRAVLARKTLPFGGHFLIPFSDFWHVNTNWYTVSFRF